MTGRLLAPLAGAATFIGRIVPSGSGSTNTLHHGATNALQHKATYALGHEPVSALGHQAAPPQAQASTAQSAGIAAVVVAAIMAAIAAFALTGPDEPEPEVAQTVPSAAPRVEPPSNGPGLYAVTEADTLSGNLFSDANPGDLGAPLGVIAVDGSPEKVGQLTTLASGSSVTIEANGVFRYDPSGAFLDLGSDGEATDQFTYVVSNGRGFSEEWTAIVSVTGVNRAPDLTEVDPISIGEAASTSVEVTATDPDFDAMTFTLDQSSPSFVVLAEASDGKATLLVTPGPGDAGVYPVTVISADGGSPPLSDAITFTITVEAIPARVADGLLVLYEFDDGPGSLVADTSGAGSPLDLTVMDPDAVESGEGALSINAPTVLVSEGAGSKVWEAAKESNELTIEAWVSPSTVSQDGPARIVSLSADVHRRNATLAQGGLQGLGGDYWTARIRTTTTSLNGLPSLSTPAGTAIAGQLAHVVLTRSRSGDLNLYLDGEPTATGTVEGDLSSWAETHPLLLANEIGRDRPWLGVLHLVAIYGKALSPAEIQQNYDVGP